MQIVEVKRSDFKSKKYKGKWYFWKQRWLNVPKEYKKEYFLVVMSLRELIDILYKEHKRKEAEIMLDNFYKLKQQQLKDYMDQNISKSLKSSK